MKKNRLVAEIIFGSEHIILNSILSADFGALDRGNVTDLIDYGIYVNRGNLIFLDHDEKFKELYDTHKETETGKVRFWRGYNETCLGTFEIEDVFINEETKKVEVSLTSSLVHWQEIKISKAKLVERGLIYKSTILIDIIVALMEDYDLQVNILSYRPNFTKIYCPDIGEDITLWNLMTQICQVGLCRIFDDEYGYPCIYDTMPNEETNAVINPSNIIRIDKPQILSIPNLSVSVLDRHTRSRAIIDTKTIYFYDNDGSPVNFEQDATISGRVSDANSIGDSNFLTVKYTINPTKPIFNVIDNSGGGSSNVKIRVIGTWDGDGLKNPTQEPRPTGYAKATSQDALLKTIDLEVKFDSVITKRATTPDAPYHKVLLSADFSLIASNYTDNDTVIRSYTTKPNAPSISLPSNDLFQLLDTYVEDPTFSRTLYVEILNTIKNRYSKPIRCVEIECLQRQSFRKYDTVIPYVVRNGKRQPYSLDINGNPSKYQIIGVEYSYQGILRQNLHLQEIPVEE